MSKKLTKELISQKVKSDRIQSIKKLNLWGSDLDDISIIQEMPSLEVVSLSVNKIRTLKDFANLKNLSELYLRKNMISDIREVKYLSTCPNLKILWLQENPISDLKNYRSIISGMLPNLVKLDDVVIAQSERKDNGDDDEEEEEEEAQHDKNPRQADNDYEEEEDEEEQNDQINVNAHNKQLQYQHQQQPQYNPLRQSQEKKRMYDEYTNSKRKESNSEEDEELDYHNPSPYRQNSTKVKGIEKRHSQNKEFNYRDIDEYQPTSNSKIRRVQTAQERPNQRNLYNYQERQYQPQQQQEYSESSNKRQCQQDYQERPRKTSANKRSAVLQSILLLVGELDKKELNILKRELIEKDNY